MNHQAGLRLRRIYFPELFNANAVALCIAGLVQLEAFGQLTAQMAARTFRKNRVGRQQFHTGLVVGGVSAIAGDSHITGQDTAHCAVFGIQNVGSRKAGENIYAQRFSLLSHPLHDIAQADNIVAMVLEAIRQQPHGCGAGTFFGQEKEFVFGHFHRDGGALRFPVWQ